MKDKQGMDKRLFWLVVVGLVLLMAWGGVDARNSDVANRYLWVSVAALVLYLGLGRVREIRVLPAVRSGWLVAVLAPLFLVLGVAYLVGFGGVGGLSGEYYLDLFLFGLLFSVPQEAFFGVFVRPTIEELLPDNRNQLYMSYVLNAVLFSVGFHLLLPELDLTVVSLAFLFRVIADLLNYTLGYLSGLVLHSALLSLTVTVGTYGVGLASGVWLFPALLISALYFFVDEGGG